MRIKIAFICGQSGLIMINIINDTLASIDMSICGGHNLEQLNLYDSVNITLKISLQWVYFPHAQDRKTGLCNLMDV